MTSPCKPDSAGPRHGREAGFTLLELIVTLSILGLALALALIDRSVILNTQRIGTVTP